MKLAPHVVRLDGAAYAYVTMLDFPAVNGSLRLQRTCVEPVPSTFARATPGAAAAPQIRLSPLDCQAAAAFAAPDLKPKVIAETEALTQALINDGPAARRRVLARAIASIRTHLNLLQRMQAEQLTEGNLKGAEQIDKMLERLTRRMAVLIEQLRHETSPRSTLQVNAGVANVLSVGGDE